MSLGDSPRPDSSASEPAPVGMVPRAGGFLDRAPKPVPLPPWLTEADIDFYAQEFQRTGFSGGLNWYRNIDRNWELLAPFAGALVTVPALYVAGDRDLVVAFRGMNELIANLSQFVPELRRAPTPRLWTLDPAGATRGRQRRHDRISQGAVGSQRCGSNLQR